MTQLQLAHASGISLSAIAQFEQAARQNPNLNTAQKLAAALGVTLDALAGHTVPQSPETKESTSG
jgi:transcriptional regulator with XRE-family HTH domain